MRELLPSHEILNDIFNRFQSIFKADVLIFYPFDLTTSKWSSSPFLLGNFLEPLNLGTGYIPRDIQFTASSGKIQFLTYPSNETQKDFNFTKRESVHSSIIAPLIAKSEMLGVLLVAYRTPKKFTDNERAKIEQAISDLAETLYREILHYRNPVVNSENIVTVSFLLPPLVSIEQFIVEMSDILIAFSSIYSVFTILTSKQTKNIQGFIDSLSKRKNLGKIPVTFISKHVLNSNLAPLRILSAHYGSPASFDLLGVGTALEVLRDIIKDITWRGKDEKERAQLEQRLKQAEITSTRLEHEKTVVDIAVQKTQLEKAKLENEKLLLDIIAQKMELVQKIDEMQLSENDKRLVVGVLLPKMEIISNGIIAGSLVVDEKKHS